MLYEVYTERFGVLLVEAGSIKEAREWARKLYEVRAKGAVKRAARNLAPCDWCDSRPCCCEKTTKTEG